MSEIEKKCSFCDSPERKDTHLFGSEPNFICEYCLIAFHRTLVREMPFRVPVKKGAVPYRCLACGAVTSGVCPVCQTFEKPDENTIDMLEQGYALLAKEIIEKRLPGKHCLVSVNLFIGDEMLRRQIDVEVKDPFTEEESELEMIVGSLRQCMGLGESDSVAVHPYGSAKAFQAHFPSGRTWALQLAGLTRKKAERLQLGNVSDPSLPAPKRSSVHSFYKSTRNPLEMYRSALESLLSGNLDMCRVFLRRIPSDSRLAAEVANILAMVEIEDPTSSNPVTAKDILRQALPFSPARNSAGKILRYNLASLLQETGELKSVEEMYREILHHDWYFLDVRERLRSISPEQIALAECRRNIERLARLLFYFRKRAGAFPESLQQLVPHHISAIPDCPISQKQYVYTMEANEFVISCSGMNHRDCGLEENEPSFRSGTSPEPDITEPNNEDEDKLPISCLVKSVEEATAQQEDNGQCEQEFTPVYFDDVSGLHNLRYLLGQLEEVFREHETAQRPFSLIMINIDHFRQINDTLSFSEGDKVLRESAELFKSYIRDSDLICRYGGDEFVIILKESDKENAVRIADRMREAFQFRFRACPVKITASVGVASYPEDATNKKDLAAAVDTALYLSGNAGGNKVSVAPPLKR